jgi:hypothetical protein
MKLVKRIALVLLFLLFFIPARSAHADVAPPPAPLLTGLEPFQYQDTQVQMVYERVELELQGYQIPDYPPSNSQVWVRASFVMRNRGKVSESMQSIFPLESLTDCGYGVNDNYSYTGYYVDGESFEIKVNGLTVPTQLITTPHPYKDEFSDACKEMHWIGFNVTFPTDTDVVVTVSYIMGTTGSADLMQNIDYMLETGAGWYGPIERAIIVAKFPYAVGKENILENTTPGYQMSYNEIFWSFQNLEPTNKDNIRISIVTPDTWESILSLRQKIKENPSQPEVWLELIHTYDYIGRFKVASFRDVYYSNLPSVTYEQAIASNPNSAELYAQYAMYQLDKKSPFQYIELTRSEAEPIAELICKALSLDSENETAKAALSTLQMVYPDLTFTPPPTLLPTATPAVSSTPSMTPQPSVTPKFGQMPEVVEVTVVQTQIVTAKPEKNTETPTFFPATALTPADSSKNNGTAGTSWILWLMLMIAGFVGGVLVSKKKWI